MCDDSLAPNQPRAIAARWLQPPNPEGSWLRSRCEAFVPVALLAAQIIFVPVGSPWFVYAAFLLSGLVVGYAIVGLILLKHSTQRWQVTPPWWVDGKDYAYGTVFVVLLFLAGAGPIIALRYLELPLPNPGSPWRYFVWCAIQDFVFFSLILRGLVDFIHPYLAIAITGVLFGFAHFPHYEMVATTAVLATAWGYLFLASRWLFFVVVSHWLMGLMLLYK